MNDIEARRALYITRFLELGKQEYWIVEALIGQEKMDRAAAQRLVSRVIRGLESRRRRRRRRGWIGLALLIPSVAVLIQPPLWLGLIPENSLFSLVPLIFVVVGALLIFHGGLGRRWRVAPRLKKPVQPLPPGQIPPGWADGEHHPLSKDFPHPLSTEQEHYDP